ncbi:MAG: hypothetical protein E6276_05010 [Clostridiales bacterium]|nr:hypothetical protein [Clostridiales bacterium]
MNFGNRRGREFFLSLPTTPHFEICQTEREISYYSLLRTKTQNAKRRGKKIYPSLTTTIQTGQNGRKQNRANKKAANLFQDLLLSLAATMAAGIQF